MRLACEAGFSSYDVPCAPTALVYRKTRGEEHPFFPRHVSALPDENVCAPSHPPPQEYLEAAVEFLEGDDSQLSVGDIKGIWVASDEPKVVTKVKEIARDYLPNVSEDDVFWASGGVEGGPEIERTATRTDKEVRRNTAGQTTMISDFF